MSWLGLGALIVALLTGALLGSAIRAQRKPRRVTDDAGPGRGRSSTPPILTAEDLGASLGVRATLVQFSSAFCAPCRATRVTLRDVGGRVEGIAVVEIDAESRLDLVRSLRVLRTPTVLILDALGRIAFRASGAPRRADVLTALQLALSGADPSSADLSLDDQRPADQSREEIAR